MFLLKRIPGRLRWIWSVLFIFLFVMTVCRFIFFRIYNADAIPFSGKAFLLGFRYDARYAAGLALFMLIVSGFPVFNPFKNYRNKSFWNIFLSFVFLMVMFFYAVDFYHFDYLHQRLNATILNYLQDAGISLKMMGQSYPLLKIGMVILFTVALAFLGFSNLLQHYQTENVISSRQNKPAFIIAFLVFAYCIAGNIIYKGGQYPLRWSDAFALNSEFKAQLSLNPFQSFLSTLKFRAAGADIKKVKAYYRLMAAQLGVANADSNQLNFNRRHIATDTFTNKPNIVVVICESFSAYKSSMYGNPLNATPFFSELCNKGVFFDRCFTPAYGTARGVWATITGIPDVESPGTASRNPNAVNQHTIINDLGYNNFYFLGGSASWANLRGLLVNNIPDLKLYEQGSYKSGEIDVWGISDKNLFLEANKVLKEQTKPFFAVIQTADNHRPYTIPGEDKASFTLKSFPLDTLHKYGFDSNEEMNAFRFTDFGYQKFMEAAQKEKYFDNTIFVFIGDHGIRGNAKDMFPVVWTEQGLTCEHVPLLFYWPKFLPPKKIHDVCSQVDILPTAASLAKLNYSNTTFGRNLLDLPPRGESRLDMPFGNLAFIIDHDVQRIGLVSDQYYFVKPINGNKKELFSVTGNFPVQATSTTDSIKNSLDKLTSAYYETAKYLLFQNKKRKW